ncbi:hypothetical protein AJ78_02166 [Emergomyces pasteurianus Ep9510]|uniref:N-acetyltransferase domain-containing protein n=1 Tax=Emergomyces pasteurianus Ep9510 TaxID=1447872 RepID=A0A1J9QR65_9EURO|nr:hypothetical protein AJ78_02166 [Emergomyces pasteurianus Ep9510]
MIWSNPAATRWSLHGVCRTLEDSKQFMSGVLRKNNPRGENFAVHVGSATTTSSSSSLETLESPRDIVSPSVPVKDKISNTPANLAIAAATDATGDQQCEPGNGRAHASEKESMIGIVGTHRTDPVAELGYIFHPSAWGKGYATEAVSAFVDRFWSEQVTANEIEAQVDPKNVASANVLRKCGFALVAEADEDGTRVLIFRVFRPGLYD